MNAQQLLATAPNRIREHRTANVDLRLFDQSGTPQPDLRARVQLVRHEFKFGCNAFGLYGAQEDAQQRAYDEQFSALLNYATLPFYWGYYERTPGETARDRLTKMAAWCADHGITTKGHPLIWHEVHPAWANDHPDAEILARMEKRVHEIVAQFQGSVDIWDVVNEATVSQRFDNAIGRWIAATGAAACVDKGLRWAREANPEAILLYNDFNLSPEFEALIADLLDRGAPLDVIGIQSHMHKGTWPLERAWEVCETYARFGLPLHFTELTVLSGRLKAPDDDDWHDPHTDWVSTPEGEAAQAEYGESLYTLLYSHPAVEAITWWDFSDYRCWQGAPAGLIRADMTPKPLYQRLLQRVHGDWSTDLQATSDPQGHVRARCTFGHYQIEAATATGDPLIGTFDLCRTGARSIDVTLQPKDQDIHR
jgi:GH35 family endo-1,4-beta-xylanase